MNQEVSRFPVESSGKICRCDFEITKTIMFNTRNVPTLPAAKLNIFGFVISFMLLSMAVLSSGDLVQVAKHDARYLKCMNTLMFGINQIMKRRGLQLFTTLFQLENKHNINLVYNKKIY